MAGLAKQSAQAFRSLVDYVVGTLLDEDTEYRVESERKDSHLEVQIYTPDAVRGRVIGRGGRIARAMRSMVAAADIPGAKQVTIDIVD